MLAPRLVKPLASLVGFPAARFGGAAGRLARENAVRNPGRTASTAAALMIGLALVTVVATLGAGLRGSTETAVKKQVKADYVVTAKDGGGSFPAASDAAIAAAAGVKLVSGVRSRHRQGRRRRVARQRHRRRRRSTTSTRFEWKSGLARRARRRRRDRDQGLRRGPRPEGRQPARPCSPPAARSSQLHVVGIHEPPKMDSLLGDVAIAQKAFDGAFARPQNAFTFVDGSSKAALAARDRPATRTRSSRPRPSSSRAAPTA